MMDFFKKLFSASKRSITPADAPKVAAPRSAAEPAVSRMIFRAPQQFTRRQRPGTRALAHAASATNESSVFGGGLNR
jgi:hypothetical protein